jgi:DnaJ family protein B protein 4
MPGGVRFSSTGGMPGGFMNAEDLFAQFFGGGHSGGMPGGMSFNMGGMGGDDDNVHPQMGGFPGMFGGARQQQQHQQQRARQPPKADVIKRALPCTLEELYNGFSKKLKITRQVQDASGAVRQEANVLVIDGKPGWKAGTKLTYPGVCTCTLLLPCSIQRTTTTSFSQRASSAFSHPVLSHALQLCTCVGW